MEPVTLSDNLHGAALMALAMVAFTLNDTCMKAVTSDLPVFQAIVVRGGLTTLALVGIGWRAGALRLPRSGADRVRIGLRTGGEVAATFTFLLALKQMPLANLSAILQALPLAVPLAAAVFMAEPLGWRRMTAILVGFAGVLLIVRPGTEGFDRWSMLGLLSMSCVVLRDLATRRISAEVSSVTVAITAALSVTAGAAVILPFTEIAPVSLGQFGLIVGASGFLIVGYLTVVAATRVGDISVVAPFRYTSLVAAILLGWAVFGQFPDRFTLAGSALVVATGVYTLHRERLRLRRAAAAAE